MEKDGSLQKKKEGHNENETSQDSNKTDSNLSNNDRESHSNKETSQLVNQEKPQSEILKDKFEQVFIQRFTELSKLTEKRRNPDKMMAEGSGHMQESVLDKAKLAFSNMKMAHEICLDDTFKLQVPEEPDKNSMEVRVFNMMRKAYWDLFDEDLGSDPPVYKSAMSVFNEIREILLSLLMPHNSSMRMRIENALDVDQITIEVEHGALDFPKYVGFVLDCLAQLCCPSRDRQVAEIRSLTKPSDIFRKMFEVMEDMHLDLANFIIDLYRKDIAEHCASYERMKFVEFLELEYNVAHDGLRSTREWLLRSKTAEIGAPATIAKAFGELISWNPEHPWPETLALDEERFNKISQTVKRATILSAMTLSVIEICKPLFANNYSACNNIRDDLDSTFKILFPEDYMNDNEKMVRGTEACAEESVRIVSKYLKCALPENTVIALKESIKDVIRADHKVRFLLTMRIKQYMVERVLSESKYKVPLNPGLLSIQKEVETMSAEFYKVTVHNLRAYSDIYRDIIEGTDVHPTFENNTKDPAYLDYLNGLKMSPGSRTASPKEPTLAPNQKSHNTETEIPCPPKGCKAAEIVAPNIVSDSAPSCVAGFENTRNVIPSSLGNPTGMDVLIDSTSTDLQPGSQKSLKHPRTISTSAEDDNIAQISTFDVNGVTTEKKLKPSQAPLLNATSKSGSASSDIILSGPAVATQASTLPCSLSTNTSNMPNNVVSMELHSESDGHVNSGSTGGWCVTNTVAKKGTIDVGLCDNVIPSLSSSDQSDLLFMVLDSYDPREENPSEDISPPVLMQEDCLSKDVSQYCESSDLDSSRICKYSSSEQDHGSLGIENAVLTAKVIAKDEKCELIAADGNILESRQPNDGLLQLKNNDGKAADSSVIILPVDQTQDN